MGNSQGSTLFLLCIAVVLFFFSLTLLPPVEWYCRFRRPALILLLLQTVLLVVRARFLRAMADRALVIATFVFAALGWIFNAYLLVQAARKC
jgi:hypothetical protein